ncbi:MAG: glycosyltransferase family 9 protein [Mariniphaga sp.]
MKKILAVRLSAMGDVSLTVPAIKGVLDANPDLEITLVTRKFFAPFFFDIPRLILFYPELNGRHKGLSGLIKLYYDLKKEGPFEKFVDLHGVIRTRIISFLFRISGTPCFSIDKGRKEKRFLLKSKYIRALKHTTERYLDTFLNAGFKGQIGKAPYLKLTEEACQKALEYLGKNQADPSSVKIGLAPFAKLKPKIWGIKNLRILVQLINAGYKVEFYLFGGGEQEIGSLIEFKQFFPNVHLVAGKLQLSEELALIRNLDLMISMDSSNMHLAALSGIPTVSIWGGTHPAFGFSALGQPTEYHLQTSASSLKCRPCSVFGKKPCIYDTPKCMEMVKPADVFNSLVKYNLLSPKVKKTTQASSANS